MAFASSDGTDVYYEVHGSGPAIMFVHGAGGNHAVWWQQVAALQDAYTVVTLDLRGFGKSDSSMAEFDSRDFPEDLIAVLDDAGLTDVLAVGQSIGAAAALKAGIRRPDRIGGVVLAHSLGGMDHPELGALVAADRAEAVKLPVINRLMSSRFQQQHPDKVFLFRQIGTFNAATMADLRNLSGGGPTIDEVEAASLFVAFLAAENDVVLSVETVKRAHELLPGSTLEVIEDAPHSMYWEMPGIFNAAVARLRDALTSKEAAA